VRLFFRLSTGRQVEADCRLDRVVGRMCELLVDVQNCDFKASRGDVFKIDGLEHHRGWRLEKPARCECCGLSGLVSGVGWRRVIVIGDPPSAPTRATYEAADAIGGPTAVEKIGLDWRRDRVRGR
jgi:hypothetical protein